MKDKKLNLSDLAFILLTDSYLNTKTRERIIEKVKNWIDWKEGMSDIKCGHGISLDVRCDLCEEEHDWLTSPESSGGSDYGSHYMSMMPTGKVTCWRCGTIEDIPGQCSNSNCERYPYTVKTKLQSTCLICGKKNCESCVSIGDPPAQTTTWFTYTGDFNQQVLSYLQKLVETNQLILEELRGQSEPQRNFKHQCWEFKYWEDEADSIIASHDPAVDFREHLANCLEDLYHDIKDGTLPKNRK